MLIRLFAIGIAVAILGLAVRNYFFLDRECLANGYGCADSIVDDNSVPVLPNRSGPAPTDLERMRSECPLFNRKNPPFSLGYRVAIGEQRKAVDLADIRTTDILPHLIIFDLPVAYRGGTTINSVLQERFAAMTDCQLCDWAILIANKQSRSGADQQNLLGPIILGEVERILTHRGISTTQCPDILGL